MLIKTLPHLISETPVARVLNLQMRNLNEAQTRSRAFARMGLVPLLIERFVHGGDNYGEHASWHFLSSKEPEPMRSCLIGCCYLLYCLNVQLHIHFDLGRCGKRQQAQLTNFI